MEINFLKNNCKQGKKMKSSIRNNDNEISTYIGTITHQLFFATKHYVLNVHININVIGQNLT